MEFKEKKKITNKGITLIALVITIIVLLILAGVAISTLTGNNGLLEKTSDAKDKSDIGAARERTELYVTEFGIDYRIQENPSDTLAEYISDNLNGKDAYGYKILTDGNNIVLTKGGKIATRGTIDEGGEIVWDSLNTTYEDSGNGNGNENENELEVAYGNYVTSENEIDSDIFQYQIIQQASNFKDFKMLAQVADLNGNIGGLKKSYNIASTGNSEENMGIAYITGFNVDNIYKDEDLSGSDSMVALENQSMYDNDPYVIGMKKRFSKLVIPYKVKLNIDGEIDENGSWYLIKQVDLNKPETDDERPLEYTFWDISDSIHTFQSEVVVPEGVTSIKGTWFYNNHSIRTLRLPCSMYNPGQFSLDNCNNLQNVYFEGKQEQWEWLNVELPLDASYQVSYGNKINQAYEAAFGEPAYYDE